MASYLPVEIDLPDGIAQGLSPAARSKLDECVQGLARDIVDEASRMEANQRSNAGQPEITSTMIADAASWIRRGYVRPPPSPRARMIQLASASSAILTGVFGTHLGETWGIVLFVVALTITIATMAYTAFGGNRDGT